MKIKAVIFDLFGTLVGVITVGEYEATLRKMSGILGAEYESLSRKWHEISYTRNTGEYSSTEEVIRILCGKLSIKADERQVGEAVDARLEFVRKTLIPKSDAVMVLKTLREMNIKTALISTCSPDTEELWDETPFSELFDVTVFSSSAGMKKPDSRIYRLALDKLGVNPGESIFVGDGDSNELTGAGDAGIFPVMIQTDNEPADIMADRQEWDGRVITSLSEILRLAGMG